MGAEASSEESSQDRQCSTLHEAQEARPRRVEPKAMYSEDCFEGNQERTPGSVTPKLRFLRTAARGRSPASTEHRDAQTRRQEGAQAPRVPRAPRVYNQQPFRRGSGSEPELATGTSSARSGGAELYAPPVNTGNATVRNASTPTMSGYPDIGCTADRPIARPVHARERVLPRPVEVHVGGI